MRAVYSFFISSFAVLCFSTPGFADTDVHGFFPSNFVAGISTTTVKTKTVQLGGLARKAPQGAEVAVPDKVTRKKFIHPEWQKKYGVHVEKSRQAEPDTVVYDTFVIPEEFLAFDDVF